MYREASCSRELSGCQHPSTGAPVHSSLNYSPLLVGEIVDACIHHWLAPRDLEVFHRDIAQRAEHS